MTGTGDRPVFVVGCARSGTTMLQQMVNAHPRLSMPPENHFVMRVYDGRGAFDDLRVADNVDKLADAIINKESYAFRKDQFRELGIDPGEMRRQLHAAPATVGSKLGKVFEAYAAKQGKARWGDKRPGYIQKLDVLLELFPDIQIIHIVRDGRDSVSSLKHMPWWKAGYEASVFKWRFAVQAGQRARAYRADQYFEFRYEDLIADPETTLGAMCEFLDEDFDPLMLQPHRGTSGGEFKLWHENTRRPVNADAKRRWERDLTPDEIALFETVAGAELRAQGYDITMGGKAPRRRTMKAWEAYRDGREARDSRWRQRNAALRELYPFPVAAALTSAQIDLANEQGWYDEYLGADAPAESETV